MVARAADWGLRGIDQLGALGNAQKPALSDIPPVEIVGSLVRHRVFVYYSEEIACAALVQAGGSEDWALP